MKTRLSLLMLSLMLLAACAANMNRAMSAYSSGDYPRAYKMFNQLAAQGDHAAERELGFMCEYGNAVPQDYVAAVFWFKKAADGGDRDAQLELGWLYERGEGVGQDFARAHDLYMKAAQQGLSRAENNVGNDYMSGRGVVRDYAKAMGWLVKATTDGDDIAPENLGKMYLDGLGVDKDVSLAMNWYLISASRGNLESELFMASVYQSGYYGMPKDVKLAEHWFGLASARQFTDINQVVWGMKEVIDAHKAYPSDAIKAKQEGTVTVSFDCTGHVPQNVHVDESSGSSLLDEAALTAVRDSTFPKLPPELAGVKHFVLKIVFSLGAQPIAAPAAATTAK